MTTDLFLKENQDTDNSKILAFKERADHENCHTILYIETSVLAS